MPSPIPSALAPYLHACLQDSPLALVTPVLDASANWLVIRLLYVALYGIDGDGRGSGSNEGAKGKPSSVIFLSLLRSQDTWIDLGKRIGLDFNALIASGRLCYIDGLRLNHGSTAESTNNKSIQLKSLDLQHVLKSITRAQQASHATGSADKPSVLILDGLDFVLASQPDATPLQLSQSLLSLRQQFTNVILTSSADSPLLHSTESSATPLELNHGIFLRTISHQSSLVMQLRPLETGTAKDVSGIIQICKGGAASTSAENLPDAEWLYHIRGDGTLKVWRRGEQ